MQSVQQAPARETTDDCRYSQPLVVERPRSASADLVAADETVAAALASAAQPAHWLVM